MSKISKFIICCIAVILSIVSLCVPTYCSSISSSLFSINLVNNYPNLNNYYNINNISYVEYKNFSITRNVGPCFYATNLDSLPTDYYNGKIFIDNYSIECGNYTFTINSSYTLYIHSSSFVIFCDSWSINGLDSVSFNMGISDLSYVFGIRWLPFEILRSFNGSFSSLHLYGGFNFSYDIVFNGQYFYNDVFCFTNDISLITGVSSNINISNSELFQKSFILTDNYSDTYHSTFPVTIQNFNSYYLYFKNLLYSDRYINNVQSSYSFNYISCGSVVDYNRLYIQYIFKYVDFNEDKSINLFSGSSTGSDGFVGSLIPNGSNNFYKTAEWWDIPSHLYNFFIYLIFDAPIISNFTNLVIVIINFIVEVFDFIIGLFTGINNIFFISIFVGIIVLIFLLKIIFKG